MISRNKNNLKKSSLAFVAAFALAPVLNTSVSAGRTPAPTPTPTPTPTSQMRSYVSGKGSDSNPCSVTLPCQTLKTALAVTSPGGEIFVLDSADYGAVTITQAVSITAAGSGAGILTTSGTAVTINAGAADVINLRGLILDGAKTGSTGIQFNSGAALVVQNTIVRNFANSGIIFAPTGVSKLFITDTTLTGNVKNGALIAPTGSNTTAGMLARITASGNGVGIFASGSGVSLTMTDTVAGNNTYGVGATTSSAVMVRNSTFSNNTVAVAADQSALVRVGQSTMTANGTGWSSQNGAQLESYGNNNLNGNATDGTPTVTLALQ